MKQSVISILFFLFLAFQATAEEKSQLKRLTTQSAPITSENETARMLRDPKASKGLSTQSSGPKYSCIDSSGAPISSDNPRYNQCVEENSRKGTVKNPITGAMQTR
ncbi:hypothetical protein K2X30_12095 [bacterium]|jgi:hypothetical protein|nr:hypothetical protein [bacterium]